MAIARKFDSYMGSSIYAANNNGKPGVLVCKKCHKANFKEIPAHYDKEQMIH